MSERRWTNEDLLVAYRLGAEAVRTGEDFLAALDDAIQANISPPKFTAEERVQMRIREMEANAERFHAKHGTKPWAGVAV